MNIGFIIVRIGGVDGVALETEKWMTVLRRMGHSPFILTGQVEERDLLPDSEDLHPLLSLFSPECLRTQQEAFFTSDLDGQEILERTRKEARQIGDLIKAWIRKRRLDLIIPENASALPCHLALGLGIRWAAEESGIPVLTHDHDFAWERGERYLSAYPEITELVNQTFPLVLPQVHHGVINSAAARVLAERFGCSATVVPNVMDFDRPYGLLTEGNRELPRALGLSEGDLPLFQVTRIVRRKGIHAAINLVHRLEDPRVKLVITGSHQDDDGAVYLEELQQQIQDLGLTRRVIFARDLIGNERPQQGAGAKPYSLGDAYAHARACTYFSTYEGFGNAFVECVLSRTPIFVNNYKPVYLPDIGSKGFKVVMLEDLELTDQALSEISRVLHDSDLARDWTEHNFELGRAHFSLQVLERILAELL